MSGGQLTEEERKMVSDLLGKPLEFPNRFKQWFIEYMAQNIPPLPIDHIQGYVKTRGYGQQSAPGAITIGAGWVDLGDGPDFDSLPDGDYLMMWGMYCPNNVLSGVLYRMGPVINGVGSPSEDQACKVAAGSRGQTGTRARVITVAGTTPGSGSLNFRYSAELWSGGPGSGAEITQSWATLIRL